MVLKAKLLEEKYEARLECPGGEGGGGVWGSNGRSPPGNGYFLEVIISICKLFHHQMKL